MNSIRSNYLVIFVPLLSFTYGCLYLYLLFLLLTISFPEIKILVIMRKFIFLLHRFIGVQQRAIERDGESESVNVTLQDT